MQRQIKFRAKSLKNNEWIEGFYVHDVEWAKHYIYRQEKRGTFYIAVANEVDGETVGQYTEMVDYKLYPIYEGDIIAMYHDSENDGKLPMENHDTVIYSFGTPFLRTRHIPLYDWIMKHDGACEVIGNIFDNPKLL